MLGRKNRAQMDLFITGLLDKLVPADHILARVNRVLDLGWLREGVADCYCGRRPSGGRPGGGGSPDAGGSSAGVRARPASAARGAGEHRDPVVHRLRAGGSAAGSFEPDADTAAWGEERFREIFRRTVRACLDAKVAKAEVVHVDASLIRADVSWESLVERHVDEVIAENPLEEKSGKKGGGGRRGGGSGRVSRLTPLPHRLPLKGGVKKSRCPTAAL